MTARCLLTLLALFLVCSLPRLARAEPTQIVEAAPPRWHAGLQVGTTGVFKATTQVRLVSNLHLDTGGFVWLIPTTPAIDTTLGARWDVVPTGRGRLYFGAGLGFIQIWGGNPHGQPSDAFDSRRVFGYGVAGLGVRWGKQDKFSVAIEAGARYGDSPALFTVGNERPDDDPLAPVFGLALSAALL